MPDINLHHPAQVRIRQSLGQSSNAFTLIELLVVIAIIGVLIALMLPAVQQVRESARRAQCANQIHQISIAIHNHQDAKKRLPPGWRGDVSETEVGWGWMAFTLPYLEQSNLQGRIDFRKNLLDPIHESVIALEVPGLQCPSSTNDSENFLLQTTFGAALHLGPEPSPSRDAVVGRTHYVASTGSIVPTENMDDGQECPSVDLLDGEDTSNGPFYQNSRTRLTHIYDGTSNTVMIGERSDDLFDSTWAGVVSGSKHTGWRLLGWTGEPPNNPMQTQATTIINDEGEEVELEIHFHGFAQFNSMHTGGVANFGMCDGSVQSFTSDVDPLFFRGLGTINGGEPVSP